VTVQPPATPPVLFFRVSPIMGTAPFVAAFTLTSTEPVQSLSLDADGDGLADHTGQDLDDVRFTYATPGLYFPTVTAVDAQSATHEATATVRVFSSAELDALILPRWTALKDALRLGNVAGALQYVAARRRTYFETMFNSLSVPLSQIDQMLGDLEFVTQRGLNVEYEMMRQEGGQTYRYAVIFVMDEDGIWRLRAL
jgi:hypothetical protein